MAAPAKRQLAKTLVVLFVGVFSILGIVIGQSTKTATAATSSYLNFQSRLLTSTGSVVADGNYNIEFKITNDISSSDGGTGACSGSCLWRETRQNSNSQGVRVVNGYLSVNLGSVTSFPAINWDQQLYLTMNIAGTGTGASPTYDGEMSPRITLTALPYAFRAGTLAKTDGSGNVGTLSFNTTANTPVITLPDATGTVCLQSSSSCGFLTSTTGVQLQGSSPGSPQTGHFNISGTGIAGTSLLTPLIDQSTAAALGIANSTATAVNIGNTSSNILTTITGRTIIKPSSGNDSTTAFQVQNSAGNNYLLVNSTGASISVGDTSIASSIQIGNTTGAVSQTISIGNNSTGSSTNNVNIGSSVAGTVAITGPTTITNRTGSADTLVVSNDSSTGIIAKFQDSVTTVFQLADGGAALFKNQTNSTAGFQVQNASAGNLFTVDSSNTRIGINNTFTAMSAPGTLTLTVQAGGSLTASSTYRYKVTAIDSAGGETTSSAENSASTTVPNKTIMIDWTAITGASGYKIYRTAAGGASNSEVYLTSVTSNTYTDAGSLTAGTATPPVTNTAYTSANVNNSQLQLTVGGGGTPTGQLYVSGTQPTLVGSYIGTAGTNIDDPISTVVQGRYAYVINNNSGSFSILDVNNPASPILISNTTANLSGPTSIFVQGRYAYITNINGTGSLGVWDISNPTSPTRVGTVTLGSTGGPGAMHVYVQGRYAYISGTSSSIMIVVDISNPTSPTIAGNLGGFNQLSSIYVLGRYAYVADDGNATLDVVDVSNPNAPTIVSQTTGTGMTDPKRVFVQGKYAYLVNFNANALVTFDISNPAAPVRVSTLTIAAGTGSTRLYVQGRYAYVTDTTHSTLYVIDISNPAAPFIVSSTTSGLSGADSLWVQGRYAYVGTLSNRFNIYDLGGAYVQQLEVGGGQFGTLSVDNNAQITGDLNIQGGISIGANIQAAANIGIYGGATVKGSTILSGNTNSGNMLGTPGAPTVAAQGTTGAVSYTYAITAVNASGGETASSTGTSIANGNNILTAINKNHITWTAVTNATAYKIYRTATGSSNACCNTTGIVGSATGTSFDDIGIIASTTTAPTVDTTGQLTVQGSALFKNSSNSTTAFQIQNAAGTSLLAVDSTSSIITFAGTTSTFISIALTNAHFKITQTTAPTIGTPSNCGGGTGPSATVIANSTDNAGSFTLTSGTTGVPTTCDTVITFNKTYGAAPKAILIRNTTAIGSATGIQDVYISASSATTFTVKFNANNAANNVIYGYYYWVVE
jgi:hypothetical protein